ncbi:MAG: ABC1 kinase family protein [Myxococcota bacterium]
MAHISVHDLPRVTEVAAVLAQHGFGELGRIVGVETKTSASDKPVAMRVRLALADLGPTFIKLGQVMSVRPDILPQDVLDELATLQDNAPTVDFPSIRAVVEEELRQPLDEVFTEFAEVPVASASIAQVHVARLADGREVAVKVQRPGIEKTLRSDLHILYTLARAVEGQISFPGLYTPVEIVQEFESAISGELDFLQEANAAERFRANHRDVEGVRVPAVLREFCTRRVLVMERMLGARLNDIPSGSEEGRAAMRRLIDSWYRQLFEHGYFHGDPHPGNLMVLPGGDLVFLDFGLTGILTGEMQDVMTSVFTGLVFRDAESVALAIYRAGATRERVDLKAFRSEIERLMAKYEGASLSQLGQHSSLTEFIAVASRYRIQLPREFAVIARATSIVDGIARRLLPDVDIVAEVRPLAQRLVASRFGPERLGADAFRLIQHAQAAFRDVPTQANQLMLDLERGRISITTRDPEAEELRVEIRHAAIRVSLAICALALAISGAVLIAPWSPAPFGVPVLAIIGFGVCVVALGMFLGLVVHWLFATRIHPRDWRRRMMAVVRFFIGERSA